MPKGRSDARRACRIGMFERVNNKIKDGIYISAYCDINSLGNVLNTSVRHDQNISLWKVKGDRIVLLKHIELEKISGEKHHRTPFFSVDDFYMFVNKVLVPYQLTYKEIKGYIGMGNIEKGIQIINDKVISFHSICHLYASMGMNSETFYTNKILALSLDAEPDTVYELNAKEKYYFAGGYSEYGNVELFPISSPGVLWTSAVDILKMQEGTLMALAFASKSKSFEKYPLLYTIKTKKDYLKIQNYVRDICNDILGYKKENQGVKFNFFDERFTEYENKVSMIMKIIQNWSLKIVDLCIQNLVEKYHINTKDTCIALAGGYCLNCPTNTYIMKKYKFKKQLIIPCVNDSGQSVGVGLYYFYNNLSEVEFCFPNAYLGNELTIYDSKYDYFIESVYDGLEYFVEDIINNPIIWICGGTESGPRALGNRSILADPRNMESKILLNKIKQREWWRPVAPIVLEEECENWFEDSFSSKYMLNNFKIRISKKNYIPAILHLDDTSRVQTLGEENELLYKAIKLFYGKTGVPILCNTSLNDRGEPIIDNIDQTFNFALRKNIQIVYINGKRYKMKNFDKFIESKPSIRYNELFVKYSKSNEICQKVNPFNVTANEYYIYANSGISYDLNITDEREYCKFKQFTKKLSRLYNQKIGNREIHT